MFDKIDTLPARPFGYSRRKGTLYCEQAELTEIVNRYGCPLYVYSSQQILERLKMFQAGLESVPHLICYAVKANSNLGILKLLSRAGAGFDIVSGGELERVLAADRRAGSRVVFSGVGKTVPEMDLALKTGIRLFNVESEAELEVLGDRAAALKKEARFALRVNPDVFAETHPYISTGLSEHKFGVAIEQAAALYQKALRSSWLKADGISVHIGSQIQSAQPFRDAVARVAGLVVQLRAAGVPLRSLDVGGGLGIDYTLDPQVDPAGLVKEYAAAILSALDGLRIELLLEPGRFLVAQAGALLTRVLYVKQNGAKTFVVVDAGMNDLIRPALYQAHHEIVAVQPKGPSKTVDVVGPVCETGDFFARDRLLPEVAAGDLLAILDAGAYGMSQSSNYNSRPRAAEVLVDGRKVRQIRRRETMRELLMAEQ